MKSFVITQKYLESKGFKSLKFESPITKINNITLIAKLFIFKTEDDFLNCEWIKDVKKLGSYLIVNENVEVEEDCNDIKKSDGIVGRFYINV